MWKTGSWSTDTDCWKKRSCDTESDSSVSSNRRFLSTRTGDIPSSTIDVKWAWMLLGNAFRFVSWTPLSVDAGGSGGTDPAELLVAIEFDLLVVSLALHVISVLVPPDDAHQEYFTVQDLTRPRAVYCVLKGRGTHHCHISL